MIRYFQMFFYEHKLWGGEGAPTHLSHMPLESTLELVFSLDVSRAGKGKKNLCLLQELEGGEGALTTGRYMPLGPIQ